MKLTSENVTKIFKECLAEGECKDITVVDGITEKFAFSNKALREAGDDIYDILHELPENFRKEVGGGWTFLNGCIDKDGNQWTGLQEIVEQLFVLGMAIGKVECLLPREMWVLLPGGVPYYVIL